jgi:hypothetical protein
MPHPRTREIRLRHTAQRRGYTLHKIRRRDPLATDYGKWRMRGKDAPRRLMTLDEIEAFLIEQQFPGGIEDIPNEFETPEPLRYEDGTTLRTDDDRDEG